MGHRLQVAGSFLFVFLLSASALAQWPVVVIVHGFMSSKDWHTRGRSPITDELIKAGFQVHIADTPWVANIEEHAGHLRQEIEASVPPGKDIVLIGHSQGGLVARLYTHLFPQDERGRRVVNVTTIGTPHRGVGKWIHSQIMEYHLWLFGWMMPQSLKRFLSVSQEMNPWAMEKFNQKVVDVPGVDYLSIPTKSNGVSAVYPDYTLNRYYYHWLEREESDGLVSARSAAWHKVLYSDGSIRSYREGQEFVGELIEANHLAQIVEMEEGGRVPSRFIGQKIAEYFLDLMGLRQLNPCEAQLSVSVDQSES